MKHCRHCNLDYQTDHRFCATCGGALAERDALSDAPALCAKCGAALRPEWMFCGHCRAPVARAASPGVRTSPQPTSYQPAAAPPFAGAEAPPDLLPRCPSCRQPMEEGGSFCEHCGARISAEARPASAARAGGYAQAEPPAGTAGGRPPLDVAASQPPVREGVGGIEEPEEDHASASAPRLEDFAGGSSPGGDPAPREGALAEAATHADEEAVDNQDATSEDEEGYEETASDVVYVEGGGTPAGYQESASPINDGGGENQSATPRPASYGEPRSFAYGEPLPTFGPEDTEEHLHPSADAGRWKWVVIGGAGLAALALVVVATVFSRQTHPPDVSPPSTGVVVPDGDAAPPAQPVPPDGMAYVPGGKFMMGRDNGDDYERPQHEATVAPFFIDKYEVTREEYQKFVEMTGHPAPKGWVGGKFEAGTGRLPVTGVSWADAAAYARWAGKRLPTEEEWEYAARGTDKRLYPWGNEWQSGLANADTSARKGMAAVGDFKGTSPYGAFDMVGNAWEWTSSQLQAYPGGRLPKQEGTNLKVIRGGSWESDRGAATTTYRWGWPAEGAKDYSSTSFRCVKDIAVEDKK